MSTSLMRRNRYDVWSPKNALLALEEMESRMWDWMSTPTGFTPLNRLFGEATTYVPPVDVYEVGEELFVAASLPGIDPAGVEVNVQNGFLTISGEQTPVAPANGAQGGEAQVRTHLAAIPRYGKFSFRLALPYEVDADRAEAAYQDGILRIRFTKPEHAKPKRITVNVSQAVTSAPAPQIEEKKA